MIQHTTGEFHSHVVETIAGFSGLVLLGMVIGLIWMLSPERRARRRWRMEHRRESSWIGPNYSFWWWRG